MLQERGSRDPDPPAQLHFLLWMFQEQALRWDEGRVSRKLTALLEALGVCCIHSCCTEAQNWAGLAQDCTAS